MPRVELVIHRLAKSEARERAADYRIFVEELEPLLRSMDRDLEARPESIEIDFTDVPTAAAAARALDETDRQARRVVAGFERGVRPESLRGRGVRLVPRGLGLQVVRAEPGSLDIVLALGGLYQAVTSQPLTFALNFGALLGYGKAVLRVITPGRQPLDREISVRLPVLDEPDHERYRPEVVLDDTSDELYPSAQVQIPSEYTNVRINMKASDGTSIKIDCSK